MNCPHCGWLKIKEGRQNFIHEEPTGNDVFVHTEMLNEFVDVFICEKCGFSWRKK